MKKRTLEMIQIKNKLLFLAQDNLSESRSFYKKQGEGLKKYFFDSLFFNITNLKKTL